MSKKKNPYSCEGGIENPSLVITFCHHSASLVMPIGDPQDGFFYLTLMMDSYITAAGNQRKKTSRPIG